MVTICLLVLVKRSSFSDFLNELHSYPVEVFTIVFRVGSILFSLGYILTADFSADRSVVFALLVSSKLCTLVMWALYVCILAFPLKLWIEYTKSLHLSLLLHKRSIRKTLASFLFALLLVISAFDLTFLRYLPWKRSFFTTAVKGYPNLLTLRFALYTSLVSNFIQTISLLPLLIFRRDHAVSSELFGAHGLPIFFFISVVNLLQSFFAVLLVVQMAVTDKFNFHVTESDLPLSDDGFSDIDSVLPKHSTLSCDSGITTEARLQHSSNDVDLPNTPDSIIALGALRTSSANSSSRSSMQLVGLSAPSSVPPIEFVDERGIKFVTTDKFADQTLSVLREQLRLKGELPLEFIPLSDLKRELGDLFNKANEGTPYDTDRLDYLLMCMELNPEYKKEKELEIRLWKEEVFGLCQDSLKTIRGFVPPRIFYYSLQDLTEKDHMSLVLAKRLMAKKCLWLVRMSTFDIGKMHIAELTGRFNPTAQGLDIVEVAAIYACLPSKFFNDANGAKEKWRCSVEENLKTLYNKHKNGTIGSGNAFRNSAYANQLPIYQGLDELHEITVTSSEDAFAARTSFTKISRSNVKEEDDVVQNVLVSRVVRESELASESVVRYSLDTIPTGDDANGRQLIKHKLGDILANKRNFHR